MKKIIYIAILLSISYFVYGQDTHFSQFNQTPMIINPAMTGSGLGVHRVGLNYREQGTSFTKGYVTYSAFYDGKYTFKKRTMKNKNERMNYFGIGALFVNDRAGDSRMGTTNVGLFASYFMELIEKHKFSIGFQGSFGQRSIDYTNLTWDSQYTNNTYNEHLAPEYINSGENFSYPDISTGITWSYKKDRFLKYIIGASLHHVNSIKLEYLSVENQVLDRRLIFHGEAEYMLNNTVLTLIPSFLYEKQGKLQEGMYGALFKLQVNEKKQNSKFLENYIGIGIYNRHNDAFITSLVVSSKNTRVGFNYDFNYSSLKRANKSKGAMEISLTFHIPYKRRKGGNTLI